MIEQLSEEFADLPMATVVATISDCAGADQRSSATEFETKARARLSELRRNPS